VEGLRRCFLNRRGLDRDRDCFDAAEFDAAGVVGRKGLRRLDGLVDLRRVAREDWVDYHLATESAAAVDHGSDFDDSDVVDDSEAPLLLDEPLLRGKGLR